MMTMTTRTATAAVADGGEVRIMTMPGHGDVAWVCEEARVCVCVTFDVLSGRGLHCGLWGLTGVLIGSSMRGSVLVPRNFRRVNGVLGNT